MPAPRPTHRAPRTGRHGVRRTVTAVALALSSGVGVLAAAGPATATAATWYVATSGSTAADCPGTTTDPCATVSLVIAQSKFTSGDTISVAPGVYADKPVFTDKGASIVGFYADADHQTVFRGDGAGFAMRVQLQPGLKLLLYNLTLTAGQSADGLGNALQVDAGAVEATDVNIGNDANSVPSGRAAYVAARASLTMSDGNIVGNSARNGGGVYNLGTAAFLGTTFSNNTATGRPEDATGNGGAIYNAGHVTLQDATLTGNRANASVTSSYTGLSGYGGAIFQTTASANVTPTLDIVYSTISGGDSPEPNAVVGGGIAVAGSTVAGGSTGTLKATNLTVSGNVATAAAGGIYAAGPTTLNLSSVDHNKTTDTGPVPLGVRAGGGGGLYVADGSAVLQGTAVTDNTAASAGGGVAVEDGATVSISSVISARARVKSNTAVRGGGIFARGGLTMGSSALFGLVTVSDNSASESGGGIYSSGSTTLTGAGITQNSASERGGGIYSSGSTTLTEAIVSNNSAGTRGGGLSVGAGTLTADGGHIDFNNASDGGGASVAFGAHASFDGTDFNQNGQPNGTVVVKRGGALFNSGDTEVLNASLTENLAWSGSAIYSGSDAPVPTQLTLSNSTIADNGGATYGSTVQLEGTAGAPTRASIDSSTIHNNRSQENAAIDVAGPGDTLTVINSTITDNTMSFPSPGKPGALSMADPGNVGVAGTVVAGNTVPACNGAVTDGGHNLASESDTGCGFTSAKYDLVGNPRLGALGDNGGPTFTRLPGPTSPVIGAVPLNTDTGLRDAVSGQPITLCDLEQDSTDQRGIRRPQGVACEIGSVELVPVSPTVTGPADADYTVGVAGAPVTFTTTGSPQPSLTVQGSLPSGVAFVDNGDGTGTLYGTPDAGAGGRYPLTVVASNEGGFAFASFTLRVHEAPALTGPTSARLVVGRAGSVGFTSDGYPAATLSVTGTLPAGLTFVDHGDGTGAVTGTPAAGTAGTYPITVRASNGTAPDASLQVSLEVLPPLAITTTTLPNAAVGTAYSADVAASGAEPPYTFALASGSLPDGLSLSTDGRITGSATGPTGTSTFTVKVVDSEGPPEASTRQLSITVVRGATTLDVDPVLLKGAGFLNLAINIANVRATLTGGSPAQPVAGQQIVFKAGSTTVCTAVTGVDGKAVCATGVVNTMLVILNGGVSATYAGSALWQPSTGSAGLIGP